MLIHPQLLSTISGSLRGDLSHNPRPKPRLRGVTVRRATEEDAASVARVAALDSAHVPLEPVLLAEIEGTAVAAISLADAHVVADPFERTADLVELLRLRAAQLDAHGSLPAAARRRKRIRFPALSRAR